VSTNASTNGTESTNASTNVTESTNASTNVTESTNVSTNVTESINATTFENQYPQLVRFLRKTTEPLVVEPKPKPEEPKPKPEEPKPKPEEPKPSWWWEKYGGGAQDYVADVVPSPSPPPPPPPPSPSPLAPPTELPLVTEAQPIPENTNGEPPSSQTYLPSFVTDYVSQFDFGSKQKGYGVIDYATNAWDYVIEKDREFNDWDSQDELERRRMRRQQEKEWLEKEEAEERAERLERIKERMEERQYEREEKAKDREALNRVQFDIGPAASKLAQTLTETSEEEPP
jgi:hypothetical protein